MSVRVSTWYCLLTCLGSVAIWSGPVWQRRWANAQPEYTIVPGAGTGESGFGCQAFIGWGKQRRAVSLSCTWSCHSPLGGLFSMRWSGRFPNIVPACADIFDFVRTGNLAAVQLMFGTGKATPWDTSVDGRGLLHVSWANLSPHSLIRATMTLLLIGVILTTCPQGRRIIWLRRDDRIPSWPGC